MSPGPTPALRKGRREGMATIVFVHGTGVRKAAFESSLVQIKEGLGTAAQAAGIQNIQVKPCLWGDSVGTRPADKSIPDRKQTGGGQNDDRENAVVLWDMLAYDSLYEMRGMALRPKRNAFPPQAFDSLVQKLPSETLKPLLEQAGIADTFAAA